jgi:hypothetical protein
MTNIVDHAAASGATQLRAQLGPAFLIYFHIAVCCLSLVYVSELYGQLLKIAGNDEARLYAAAANVAPFALVSILFTFCRFSFGYFLGFNFFTMILGYLWLVEFSKFSYDHVLATASAFASALAFLVPALFIVAPIKQRFVLSAQALDRLLSCILFFAAAIIAIGAFYNFRLVGLSRIYDFRGELEFPRWLMYAMGVTSNASLPFAFACFVARGKRWRAALSLVLLLLFYPVTLSKLALFSSFWLTFLTVLCWFFRARTVVVLSVLIPTSVGVLLALLFDAHTLSFDQIITYFGTVNFRMIALPSSALDFYNDFFSTHELTHFCQINVLKPFIDCPYREPLAIVMQETYHIGNFNASLFATEGIASVGPLLAPLAVLVCGLVISLGNRLSAGLPPNFILLSSGIIPQTFLNVPLTIGLVTNGAAVLFLLWYVTPRSMFENEP